MYEVTTGIGCANPKERIDRYRNDPVGDFCKVLNLVHTATVQALAMTFRPLSLAQPRLVGLGRFPGVPADSRALVPYFDKDDVSA